MTNGAESKPTTGKRPLWAVLLLVLAAAGLLWAASSVTWFQQRYRSPLGGASDVAVTGEMLWPELVPLALASLAAGAAVLATRGWFRRCIGLVVVAIGAVLGWRLAQGNSWSAFVPPEVPTGSEPVGAPALGATGPLLLGASALCLLAAGVLVVVRGGRMPAMGAKYSAPGATKPRSQDVGRRMWDDLNEGRDPTEEDR
ncbi:hypothetical protein GU90_09960 [Saccharopolyspora rectivirgula]|uniref:Trp biosynthesis associated, transmembrane protein, Oprn/Chp n=1 Tax=Saccharopolyspora rectivirgula TaxID=28042 RepID=A0A073AYK5_9PSEU|nr:hypothetical protein GU90_09960 [Saccharopolyspora rectivirgula]